MGQTFHPYDSDQPLLLTPSLRDWMPDGHSAHFISGTIDQLDLKAFYRKYAEREDGRGQLLAQVLANTRAGPARVG